METLYLPMNDKFTLTEFPRDYGDLKHASIIGRFQWIQQYSQTKCPPWFSQPQKHCELQCFKKKKPTLIHVNKKTKLWEINTYMYITFGMNVYTNSLILKYKGNNFHNKTINTTFVHCPWEYFGWLDICWQIGPILSCDILGPCI